MRFLGYTVGDDSIPTPPPSPEMMQAMGQFVDEMTASGHLIATGAFAPIATGTTKVSLRAAAVPQTPRPSGMRTQATLPWNGPSTSSQPRRK